MPTPSPHDPSRAERAPHDPLRAIAFRWKVLFCLGAVLIALGVFIDWPAPPAAGIPETSSFLVFLGALVGGAGLLAGLPHD